MPCISYISSKILEDVCLMYVIVSFVNLGKCDFCPYRANFKLCTEVRVFREGSGSALSV